MSKIKERLETLHILSDEGVPTLNATDDIGIAMRWRTVYCKQDHIDPSWPDLRVVNPGENDWLPYAEMYSEGLENWSEWAAFVLDSGQFAVLRQKVLTSVKGFNDPGGDLVRETKDKYEYRKPDGKLPKRKQLSRTLGKVASIINIRNVTIKLAYSNKIWLVMDTKDNVDKVLLSTIRGEEENEITRGNIGLRVRK